MRIDMSRLKDIITIAIMLAVPIALVGLWVWMWSWLPDGNSDNEVSADTLRVVVYDTIPYFLPVPKEEKPLGNITAKLPVSVPKLPESVQKFPETPLILQDSVGNFSKSVSTDDFPDSVDVEIPITQKVYEDSAYRAYVSGYRASLDSLLLFPQCEVVTITAKPKRWTIGLQMGYGITLKETPQFTPYIGIGVSYNFFSY